MTSILITGSSRGIGAAAFAALAERGVNVIGHATTASSPDTIAADFSAPQAAQMLWEEALDRSGGNIAAVVNNAGIFEANRLNRSDIEWLDAWEDTLRINLTAAAQLSRYAVNHWLARPADSAGVRGRLVHVASRAAYRGDSPAHWHYAAAKGGMVAMHKTIARAYADQGVLSFAITPGFT
ncbi:MAG: SDR family oxidoreductase, partial [Pseudomonadota bacterium]